MSANENRPSNNESELEYEPFNFRTNNLRFRLDDLRGLTENELATINHYNRNSTLSYLPADFTPPLFEYQLNGDDRQNVVDSACINFALGEFSDWRVRRDLHNACKFIRELNPSAEPKRMQQLRKFADDAICGDRLTDPERLIRPVLSESDTVPEGYHLVAAILLGNNKPNEPFHYYDFHFYRKMSNGCYFYKSAVGEVCTRHNKTGGLIRSIKPNVDGTVNFITEDNVMPVRCNSVEEYCVSTMAQQLHYGDRIARSTDENFYEPSRFLGYYIVADKGKSDKATQPPRIPIVLSRDDHPYLAKLGIDLVV